jgi:high frequency lysogenization protein
VNVEGAALGLAGAFQAAREALSLARDGRCNEDVAAASIASVMRLDADDPAGVFGGVPAVRPGLEAVLGCIEGKDRDPQLTRIVVTVLTLARKFGADTKMRDAVRTGVAGTARSADHLGQAHDTVYERLGELYAQTFSTLQPRVMVQGNGLYLSQPRIVTRIRALLLAAIRAGVLWRQCGGNQWQLVWRRRRIADAARTLLQTTP